MDPISVIGSDNLLSMFLTWSVEFWKVFKFCFLVEDIFKFFVVVCFIWYNVNIGLVTGTDS